MKMPERRFGLFSYPPKPDIFGLHHLTILSEACLSDAERKERVAKIEAFVAKTFKAATYQLGDEQSRQLFARVLRRAKRGQGKAHVADRDLRLLKAYFDAGGDGKAVSIAALAKKLHAANGTKLGSSPHAIAVRIGKLLREQAKSQKERAIQQRYWRMAARHDPPTILGAHPRKK